MGCTALLHLRLQLLKLRHSLRRAMHLLAMHGMAMHGLESRMKACTTARNIIDCNVLQKLCCAARCFLHCARTRSTCTYRVVVVRALSAVDLVVGTLVHWALEVSPGLHPRHAEVAQIQEAGNPLAVAALQTATAQG